MVLKHISQRRVAIKSFAYSLIIATNLTAIQAKQLAEFQITAIANFQNRFIYGMISFLLLCVVPFFLPQLNRSKTKNIND